MTALPRVHAPELMDQPDVAPVALAQSLADLRRVNRWLGGARAALSAVLPLLREIEGPEIRVLDVATGSADIPLGLAQRARQGGLTVRIVATDAHPATVAMAREAVAGEPAVEVASANALDLPFAGGEFHVAMCHTALHHFDDDAAIRLLGELSRVATHSVVVTDLRRSAAALLGVQLLGATVWRRHPVTRHDSAVSIRGAFTPDEACCLAREVGLPAPRIRRHALFRYSLISVLAGGGR